MTQRFMGSGSVSEMRTFIHVPLNVPPPCRRRMGLNRGGVGSDVISETQSLCALLHVKSARRKLTHYRFMSEGNDWIVAHREELGGHRQ